jgi:hypothetical protein
MYTDKPTLRVARHSTGRFYAVGDSFNIRVYPHPQGVDRGCKADKSATTTHCSSVADFVPDRRTSP